MGGWVLVAVLAPLVAPFEPNFAIYPMAVPGTLGPEGNRFWFGTDQIGRDILSRVIWSAHNLFALVGGTVVLSYLIGIPIALAATARNWLLARLAGGVIEVARAIPVFISYFVLGLALGFGITTFVVAFVFASLPSVMDTLSVWRSDSDAAETERESRAWTMTFSAVNALKRFAFYAAIAEGIAFLGFGPLPPPIASFGGMLNETRQLAMAFPHMALIPIAAFCTLLLGAGLLASGLESLLPASLRSADPAKPSYRPADPA